LTLHRYDLQAQAFAIGIVLLSNFNIKKYWTFGQET